MKTLQGMLVAAAVLLCAAPAVAQSGCVNSPENPTALLAVVGAAGGYVSYLRARRASRRKK